jgi:hypothetical protein
LTQKISCDLLGFGGMADKPDSSEEVHPNLEKEPRVTQAEIDLTL